MKRFHTYLPCILILLLFLLPACKKKGSSSAPDNPEVPVIPVIPKDPEAGKKVLFPQSINMENLKVDFQYAGTENLLAEIRQSNGTREMILYNAANHPKEYRRFIKDVLVYHVYYLTNQEGLITKGIQYNVSSDGKSVTPIGNYQISYNSHGNIEAVEWYDFKNVLIKSKHYTYDNNLLLTDSKTTDPSMVLNFRYDEQAGIFRQVVYIQSLAIENPAFYFLNQKSNVKSIVDKGNPAADLKFEMQYNNDGYPSTITQTDVAQKSKVYKITYR